MRHLPITESWNETVAFVGREAGLLFPVAFALIALPGVVFQFFMPAVPDGQIPQLGSWVWLIVPLLVLSVVGSLALTELVLRPGVSVGEALATALRRTPAVLGAVLLLGLAGMVVMIPVSFIAALLSGGNVLLATTIMMPFVLLACIVIGVRLVFLYPVGAMESAGPLSILRRSWTLTRGHFWRLFSFLVLVLLVAMILSLAISAMVGIVVSLAIGSPQESDAAKLVVLLVSGLVSTAISVYLIVMIARLYAKVTA